MKTFFKILLLLVFVTAISYSQSDTFTQVKYYKVSKVKVFINDRSDIRKLREQGIRIEQVKVYENYFETYMDSVKLNNLKKSGYPYEIIIDDVTKDYLGRTKESREQIKLKKPSKPVGFGYGSMGGFYTYDEVVAQLDAMRSAYPNLITEKDSIGSSFEGRTIWAVKISDNPDLNEDEPQVFYNSLIHAREPEGMMAVIYFMYYLLENYGNDPEVTYLVDNREFYFVPVINPDGYVYNQQISPNGGGMWRKNKRDGTGVDLARNFGYMWGYDDIGSDPYPNWDCYRGTGPFSEPESQVIRDFILSKNFKVINNFHSFWNVVYAPWGYNMSQTPDSIIYNSTIRLATQLNGYRNGFYVPDAYPVNGYPCDWNYGEQTLKPKIFSFLTEVGDNDDGFWPIPERIYPLAEENVYPNIVLAWGPQIIENPPYISEGILNSHYFKPLIDTIKISVSDVNPDNHSSNVYAKVFNSNDSLVNELQMNKIESFYVGSVMINSDDEEFYRIVLEQDGLDIPSKLFFNELKFTTAGPVEIDTFRVTRLDSNNVYVHNILLANGSNTYIIPNVSVRIKSISSGAESNDNIKNIGSITPAEIKYLSGGYVIDINQCSSDSVELVLEFYSDNYPYWEDKLKFKIPELFNNEGMNVAVYDEMNDVTNWTSSGGWGLTNSKFVSAPTSFTDSPSGNYTVNATAALTYKNNLSLLNALYAFLEFDAQWEIEGGWDYAQVQISTNNGSNWIPLNGQYTRIATGGPGSIQPPGQPVYDGTQSDWIHEIIDLSDYLGKPLNLRFLLKSNDAYNFDGWYIDNVKISYYTTVLAEQPYIDKLLAEKNVDSVLFRIKLTNLFNHQFTSHLIYANLENTNIDSITLFDDGLHGDSLAIDDIYGGYIPPRTEEDFYSLSLSTMDQDINTLINNQDILRFTTVPLVIDSVQSDSISNFRYSFKPFLKNTGTQKTITNITVKLLCSDPWATAIYPEFRTCPNLLPGQTSGTSQLFAITYDPATFPGFFNLKFEIMSNGWKYWEDTEPIIVGVEKEDFEIPTEFSLSQNYPNPFNPSTTIKYSLPELTKVKLFIYNLLGEKVKTLIDEEKPAGNYELEFNAENIPSGVYFYQLKAGDFVETKKMLLLK